MRMRNVPLRKIRGSWNNLYGYVHSKKGRGVKIPSHWIKIRRGMVKIFEQNNVDNDGLKEIVLSGQKLLYFPVDSYKDFNMWNALSDENCDGIVMYKSKDNEISIELVELKSTFDTSDYLKARRQITISLQKLFLLLNGLPVWKTAKSESVHGVIFSYEPDADTLDWIKQMEMLPKESWRNEDKLGLTLAINNSCEVGIPNNVNIPGLPNKINLQRVWCTSDTCNNYTIGTNASII